jgi:amino acid transporter
MPVVRHRLLCIVFVAIFFSLAPTTHGINPNRHGHTVASVQNPFSTKPTKLKQVVLKGLSKKKYRSAAGIAFGILSVLLLSFILFGVAYSGASGGVVVLIAILGLALIVLGLIRISKRKRKKEIQQAV